MSNKGDLYIKGRTEHGDIVGIKLAEACWSCEGSDLLRCDTCNGRRFELTEQGEAIIKLVRAALLRP